MSNMYGYNTSSAYKFDIEIDDIRRANGSGPQRNGQEEKTHKTSAAKSSFNFANLLRVAICFIVAFVIVSGYVKINEAYGELSRLEDEYNKVVATNQDIQVKIDKAIDLEQLQTVASERFGMVRPERYQMFYVDMQQGDMAESYEDSKSGSINVKGVAGTITSAMNIFD